MATYTVTTGTAGSPVDYAALGTRVNGDIYNINGGYLLVDCDSRYGLGGATAAAFGNIVGSAALGGTIEFNSTKVRLIPFNTGTGNVPANDTVISLGGASAKLMGVYSALNVAPTAVAAAMPASGYIKVRAWNSVAYTAAVLTGIGATATAADGPGWLECVGLDAQTATINRLNTFTVRGDYYTFQNVTTTGANSGTYQLPTNGSAVVYCPGVEVETAVASGVYEFFPCAGSRTALAASIATDAVRGKVCWIAAGTGLVRFGHDGTNSTGGYTPVSGCKIRVPNIFFTCCVAAAVVNILPNATLATRYEFATTGGGVIDIDKASINWYCNFAQAFDIKAFKKDSVSKTGGTIIEVTDFFKGDNQIVSLPPFTKTLYKITSIAADRSYIQGIKTFPINTEIRTVKTFNGLPATPSFGPPSVKRHF